MTTAGADVVGLTDVGTLTDVGAAVGVVVGGALGSGDGVAALGDAGVTGLSRAVDEMLERLTLTATTAATTAATPPVMPARLTRCRLRAVVMTRS